MTGKADTNLSREARLAAKLRENLRRRKQQARLVGETPDADRRDPLPNPQDGG